MSKRDKILLILHTIDYKYNLHQHFILPISWLQKFKEKSNVVGSLLINMSCLFIWYFPHCLAQCQNRNTQILLLNQSKQP